MSADWSVDVMVVGGGPAGLAAARAAAERGARTLLLERNGEIGGPVRTSGATWLADVDALRIPRHLVHPVERLRFIAPGREAAWRYRTPRAGILDVRGLYQHLAERAAAAGSEIRLRHAVLGAVVKDGRLEGARLRDDAGRERSVACAVAVDASGTAAILASSVGLRQVPQRLGVGAEVELLAPRYDQREAVLLVGRQVAPRGYAWAFPRGDGRVRVGVGVLRPESDLDPRALLEPLRKHPALEASLEGSQPIEYHVGALPSDAPPARLSTDRLLVAGDSGLQASPLVGEGIRYAIQAGALAGDVAARCRANGDASAAALRRYDQAWRRRFAREHRLAYWLNRRLVRYGDRNWRVVAALLAKLSPEQVAAGLHGDFTVRWWLGLAVRSPWLTAAAVGALRRNPT